MKKIISFITLSILISFLAFHVNAHITNPLNTLGNKATDRVNNQIDSGVDKGLDDVEGSLKNEDKDKSDQNEANSVASGSSNSSTSTGNSMANTNNNSKAKDDPLLTSYSKYDFIPESEFLFFDDFSQDAVADFPALWNTDASGEIVTTNNFTGKWLKLTAVGNFIPEYYKTFPDNFTLEFDVIPDEQAVLGFDIYKAENPKDINEGVAIPRRRHKNMV